MQSAPHGCGPALVTSRGGCGTVPRVETGACGARVVGGGQRLELQARVQGTAHGGRASAPASAPLPVRLEVVYEDDHLAVVVKPPGMPVQVLPRPSQNPPRVVSTPRHGHLQGFAGQCWQPGTERWFPAPGACPCRHFLRCSAAQSSCSTSHKIRERSGLYDEHY